MNNRFIKYIFFALSIAPLSSQGTQCILDNKGKTALIVGASAAVGYGIFNYARNAYNAHVEQRTIDETFNAIILVLTPSNRLDNNQLQKKAILLNIGIRVLEKLEQKLNDGNLSDQHRTDLKTALSVENILLGPKGTFLQGLCIGDITGLTGSLANFVKTYLSRALRILAPRLDSIYKDYAKIKSSDPAYNLQFDTGFWGTKITINAEKLENQIVDSIVLQMKPPLDCNPAESKQKEITKKRSKQVYAKVKDKVIQKGIEALLLVISIRVLEALSSPQK